MLRRPNRRDKNPNATTEYDTQYVLQVNKLKKKDVPRQ